MATQEKTQALLDSVRKLAPLIRTHAGEAEQNRRLSQPVVAALAEAGIFRLFIPRTLGGLEVDPLTFSCVLEEIARIDGSTGWCVWIGGANPLFVAPLADQAAEEIFGQNPYAITGSAFFPYGKAVVQDGGYVVRGRWPYASGCHHCTWYFVLCNVFDADQPRLTASGEPEVRAFFMPITQVTILDTWDVSGLAGPAAMTSSSSRSSSPRSTPGESARAWSLKASTSRVRCIAIPSTRRSSLTLAPSLWVSHKGRWTQVWSWRKPSGRPGPPNSCATGHCFRSGWRRR